MIWQWKPGWIHVRSNYHGTCSSQLYHHQAHILLPRRLVNRQPTKTMSDLISIDKSHQHTSLDISHPDILKFQLKDLLSTVRRKKLEDLTYGNMSSPQADSTNQHHQKVSSVVATTMPYPHLSLGDLMVKKPRRKIPPGNPITQFRDAKKNTVTQFSLEDLNRINTLVQMFEISFER